MLDYDELEMRIGGKVYYLSLGFDGDRILIDYF